MRQYDTLGLLVVVGLIVSACSMPSNSQPGAKIHAVFTSAAQTLEAKLTQSPAANPGAIPVNSILPTVTVPAVVNVPTEAAPTETQIPAPTNTLAAPTPEPTQVCDAAQFISDVTIPDGTVLNLGQTFTKTWRLKNIGICPWNSSYTIVFDVGDQMGGPLSIPLPVSVAPGQEVDLSVDLQAPGEAGKYRSYWRLRNPEGFLLSVENGYKKKSFYVDIQVKNDPGGLPREFAVTNVTFNVTRLGTCETGSYVIAAAVRANRPGEISYSWKRSDGTTDPLSNGKLVFETAGTQAISYTWASGATGLSVTLSILTPIEQDFGPALLNCP